MKSNKQKPITKDNKSGIMGHRCLYGTICEVCADGKGIKIPINVKNIIRQGVQFDG